MKTALKQIVVSLLTWEARLVLKKYKPKIIGVTGNIGKTSTKDAIFSVVSQHYSARKSVKSYNGELGVPLTVLGRTSAWSGWVSVFGWLAVIFAGLHLLLVKHPYPEWLVLEVGADRPDDIRRIAAWLPCDIVVMTTIPEIPVHIEFFKDKQELVNEKFSLPLTVGAGGTVIINADDSYQHELLKKISERAETDRPRVITYGQSELADLSAREISIRYDDSGSRRWPSGLGFSLVVADQRLPVNLAGVIGRHHIYVILPAFAVARVLNLSLLEASAALSKHEASPGRLRPLPGIKDTLIIDDSYNASPDAVKAALETLRAVETTGRRIAILGDMMELGSYTIEAHRQIGELVVGACDYLVAVGLRARFIVEGAKGNGFPAEKIGLFDEARAAGRWLQNFIEPGDVILVKGSQSVRLERVVEEIMAQPENKEKLLVRQEKGWQGKS